MKHYYNTTMVKEIKLKGDKEIQQVPSIKDKALRINMNENIYKKLLDSAADQGFDINKVIRVNQSL